MAENADDLIVYGGHGKAVRDHASFNEIVNALRQLRSDETLVVQSGRPVALFPTHEDAPRVLISTAMLVPDWSTWENFWALEEAGLTMFGQMTAAGWFYIGTQGVLGFTYETFASLARQHFHGRIDGKRVLTAGLGGMGGAQGLGIAYNGGCAFIVEADSLHAKRRYESGWVDYLTDSYHDALRKLDSLSGPGSVALIGNIADVAPRLVRDRVWFDVATDQTAAHDLLRGYIPSGYSVTDAGRVHSGDASYMESVRRSLLAHVEALLELRDRGAVVFEYGNNLRAQAVQAAGVRDAASVPGFVAEYVRPILSRGVGPYRWICLSGDSHDLRRTEEAILEVVNTAGLKKWFQLAQEAVPTQGLPARVCWLGLEDRKEVSLRLNELVRQGCVGPLALGRDHMDPGSVASPTRETEGMRDGSDAIADWPILNALLNSAQGASWVAVGNGGGVGIGRSIHTGMVVIADGSELAERKIRRTFWTDPALGVARYVDAGYPEALETARRAGLDLPHHTFDRR